MARRELAIVKRNLAPWEFCYIGLLEQGGYSLTSEQDLPPDAYGDQNDEQIHKKRKVNASPENKDGPLARI